MYMYTHARTQWSHRILHTDIIYIYIYIYMSKSYHTYIHAFRLSKNLRNLWCFDIIHTDIKHVIPHREKYHTYIHTYLYIHTYIHTKIHAFVWARICSVSYVFALSRSTSNTLCAAKYSADDSSPSSCTCLKGMRPFLCQDGNTTSPPFSLYVNACVCVYARASCHESTSIDCHLSCMWICAYVCMYVCM
jgi:hypothetical protein